MDLKNTVEFSIEAITPDALAHARPEDLFQHVLSMPVSCPLCDEQWVLLTDAPIALEIEMGLVGKTHLSLLAEALSANCGASTKKQHFRTDGSRAWVPE